LEFSGGTVTSSLPLAYFVNAALAAFFPSPFEQAERNRPDD
jgi:hypothetical protein